MGTTGLALQKRLRHLHLFTFDFGRWTSFFFWLSWLSQQPKNASGSCARGCCVEAFD